MAKKNSASCQNPRVSIGVLLTTARMHAASGDLHGAVKAAESAKAEARRRKIIPLELEVELVAAQVAMKESAKPAAVARFKALERRATAAGFILIARQAQAAGR